MNFPGEARIERPIPLVGTAAVGPLGLCHLPRMWLKGLLAAVDALPPDYTYGDVGLEKVLLAGIGCRPSDALAALEGAPSYLAFERWVTAHATRLDAAAIAATNTTLLGYRKAERDADAIWARTGLADPEIRTSAALNDLDDWCSIHELLVGRRGALPKIVPAVSSHSVGPLGLKHLARLWIKALLHAAGALPPGYNTGPRGFDLYLAGLIGIDLVAAAAFFDAEMPPYLQFEAWVRAHATAALDPGAIAAYNGAIETRTKSPERAVIDRAEAGVDDPALGGSILLNDLVEWKTIHDEIVARERGNP